MALFRLGEMLHLEIQKGKEAINTLEFQKDIRGTDARMKRQSMANKGCGQMVSNDTYFDDSWFSYVKMDEEAMDGGVDY